MNIQVGATYKLKTRVRTVTGYAKGSDIFVNTDKVVVLYKTKDGGDRWEFVEAFQKWIDKGAEIV